MNIRGILAVTPDDDDDLAHALIGFVVDVAGDVAVNMGDGTTGVLPSMTAGTLHLVPCRRILATGTTATGIVGLY